MDYNIQTEEDYQLALQRFIKLCEGPKDEQEVKEMTLLMALMTKYEQENCSIN